MVGNGSPSFADTLNRQISVEHNIDGTHGAISVSGNIKYSSGNTIASAATLTIPSAGSIFAVSGAVAISGIATVGVGTQVTLRFLSTPTLIHSASLILPNAANINTVVDDVCTFYEYGVGQWMLINKSNSGSAGFGSWSGLKANNTNFLAATDLIVHAYGVNSGGSVFMNGYTDGTSTPTTKIVFASANMNVWVAVTMAVKKNDYWKINVSGTSATIRYLSMGS